MGGSPGESALTWSDPIDRIKGLGIPRATFLKEQGIATVGELLLRAPIRFIDRRISPPFNSLVSPPAHEITAIGRIESVGEKFPRRPRDTYATSGRPNFGKKRLICIISDGTGTLQGVWFGEYRYYLSELTPGRLVAFSGQVKFFDGPQIVHPKVTYLDDDVDLTSRTGLVPVYPSGAEWERAGLSRRQWPRLIERVISMWDGKGPYMPEDIRIVHHLANFTAAVRGLHRPDTPEEYEIALKSLKFAELYHHQLLMVALRRRRRRQDAVRLPESGERWSRFQAQLPFTLSKSQTAALDEIASDFASGRPMYRLLQGEVGAGKTIVAFGAAALAADGNHQTALMAPTEILARQHYENALKFLEPAGLKAVLLTAGRDPDEVRRALFETSIGGADLIIGTHALLQQRVMPPRLGLVVIDEQQRFGVRQRALLVEKGVRPHVLLMTATPIPRTLALAHYGDLDLTYLDPPEGYLRRVKTRLVNEGARDKVFEWLRGELAKGRQAYFVFPVIDEGPAGLQAAEARFEPYRRIDFSGIPMALMHGRKPVEERVAAIEAFRRGDVRLLATTSVIEVGVDVPMATIMVIENSERFGLAQLHQLRGRVGRAGQTGVCVMITTDQEGGDAWRRLKVLETVSDGLALAEEDLRNRGAGEPLGTRQAGVMKFRFADLTIDYDLLLSAHQAAEETLDRWNDLSPFPELRELLRREYRSRPRTILAG
ncbi:MAG: ATP-dependent DNA helicase RecG [Calditrichaeota bacterium]|nr:ATP-dependent DNA helicase RecG [Calditrichota bacterium]